MSNNRPIPPSDGCAECRKPFSKGQEYWELERKGVKIMFCTHCRDEHNFKKKQWEK